MWWKQSKYCTVFDVQRQVSLFPCNAISLQADLHVYMIRAGNYYQLYYIFSTERRLQLVSYYSTGWRLVIRCQNNFQSVLMSWYLCLSQMLMNAWSRTDARKTRTALIHLEAIRAFVSLDIWWMSEQINVKVRMLLFNKPLLALSSLKNKSLCLTESWRRVFEV